MREQAGRSEETLETARGNARPISTRNCRRATVSRSPREQSERGGQQRIRRLVAPLADGDAVVFIPPVAGG